MEASMTLKTLLSTMIAAGMLTTGMPVLSQQQHQHEPGAKPPAGRGGMKGQGGMMGGMDMMRHCQQMMGGHAGHAMPQLPPGNEKLQLQMHADMMQKVGEILSKYAAQVK
jgi:hypothetical protein